jgi:hypothetical protein
MSFHLVGIDEAGYGPQLGPLVVSAVDFELPDNLMASSLRIPEIACLWKKLSPIVTRGKSSGMIAVCDSKALYSPARGLKETEQTALVFKRLLDPGYESHTGLRLPLFANRSEIGRLVRALGAVLAAENIRFAGAQVSIIEPAEFNDGIRRLSNKADLLWEASGRLIKNCADKYAAKNPVIIRAGKQGGRNYYLDGLRDLFGGQAVRASGQGFDRSSYLIGVGPPAGLAVSFIRNGDASEFVIALASIFSKYYRELSMLKLNGFFMSRLPSLKPTAGYYPDSRRFIRAVSPLMGRLGLDRDDFIRLK